MSSESNPPAPSAEVPASPSDTLWRARAAAVAGDWREALRAAVPVRDLWQRDMVFDDAGFWMRVVGGPGRPTETSLNLRRPPVAPAEEPVSGEESFESAAPAAPVPGKTRSLEAVTEDWLKDRRKRARWLQHFIAGRLQWMAYSPTLAVGVSEEFGGFDEYKWRTLQKLYGEQASGKRLAVNFEPTGAMARRLQKFIRTDRDRGEKSIFGDHVHAQLMGLAAAYRTINGGYFICIPPKDRPQSDKRAQGNYKENWHERLEHAEYSKDTEAVWACELALKGRPGQFTDFYIVPLHGLRKANGKMESLVRLVSRHGKVSDVVPLGGEWKSTPTRFRDWFGNIIHGTWGAPHTAGQNELDALMGDLAHEFSDAAEVRQLTEWGWHAPSKSWFSEDLAILPGGRQVRADADGIFWFDRQAYRMVKGPHGRYVDGEGEGNQFKQPPPRWQPEIEATETEIRQLFIGLADALHRTLGGAEFALVLGLVFAYAASPEIFRDFKAFPGLFLHGQKGQGKSWIARLCMRIYGFDLEKGVVLQGSTSVGINEALMQVSGLPVWLDEFSLNVIQQVQDKIKNAYDRSASTKHGDDRPINTTPLVVGEHTVKDAATKSRYGQMLVSAAKRLGTDAEQQQTFQWMQAEMPRFFLLGRHALLNREAFVPAVLRRIREFLEDPVARQNPDDRARLVHAVAYAGYEGMAELLRVKVPSQKDFLIAFARAAAAQQAAQVNLNVFWDQFITCQRLGIFGETPQELRRFFYVERTVLMHPPGRPGQGPWESYRLFPHVSEVLAKMQEQLGRQKEVLPLSRNDILQQMQPMPYWLDGKHNKRFAGAGSVKCWGIAVDEFGPHNNAEALGYIPHSDEDLAETRNRDAGPDEFGQCPYCSTDAKPVWVEEGKPICCAAQQANPRRVVRVNSTVWSDPRKGPLIELCERVLGEKVEK
jgi:hypothetical protein